MPRKSEIFKKISAAFLTLLLTLLLLSGSTRLLERKDSRYKYDEFFKEKNYDVFFLGTSHIMNGIFPMELWRDYGITSYNFGNHGAKIGTSYWAMRNALDYATPKVIVMDIQSMRAMEKMDTNFAYEHLAFDAFPLSGTKILAVEDIFAGVTEESLNDRDTEGERPSKLGLLWDYSVYHSRWNDLNEGDFTPSYSPEKGADSRIAVAKTIAQPIPVTNETLGYVSDNENALCDTLEYCQNHGIQVILTYIPV